jgi:D-alanyl-D-alanine carboxypeptidase (penicillin-binding protein 5/6)
VKHALALALTLSIGAGAVATATAEGADAPAITARSALVVDARDGHVLYRRAARDRRAIASTTKLMTALIAIERLPLGKRLAAPVYRPGPLESRINLRPGERMSVADLLRALRLESAHDAAVTLARGVSGSVPAFVARMNARARALGLRDTHFSNPIGLDQRGNYSSASDLSVLARRLLRNDTFATIVDQPNARLTTGARPRVVDNRNDLVARFPWIDGVKTGHTQSAAYVLVGAGERRGVQLVSVVLGEPSEASRDSDTLGLLGYGFSRYHRVRALRAGAVVASADVRFYGDRSVKLTVARDVALVVRRGERVRVSVSAPDELEGPLRAGERVGSARVFNAGRLTRIAPLVTADDVPKAAFLRKASSYLSWVGIVLATALALAIALRFGRGWRPAPRRAGRE